MRRHTGSPLRTACSSPAFLLTLALLGGCSWTRFDDVSENAPVVVLEQPGALGDGFAVNLATVASGDDTLLIASGPGGTTHAALFNLGEADDPTTGALLTSICDSNMEFPCVLGSSLAPLASIVNPEGDANEACFAVGIGQSEELGIGVVIECLNREVFTIPVPADIEDAFEDAPTRVDLSLASDGADPPGILAADPDAKLAWFYLGADSDPVELTPPEAPGETFGARVAAGLVDDQRLYAVSAPMQGTVLLFAADAAGTPSYVGCLGGDEGFGDTLAFGDVSDSATPELLVHDGDRVLVLDSTSLLGLGGGAVLDCPPAVDSESLLASLECDTSGDLEGCRDSDFGAALAAGDVDGDGDGEVLVGAPRLEALGVENAGAVLVYDLDSNGDTDVADARYMASAESNDYLGGSLAAARQDGRDVIVAGAPGAGEVALFYCSALDDEDRSRCH